jgi:phosphatidylserine decarboxylase
LKLGSTVNIPGQYYTVNPQAVNETGFDVFTSNKRSILYATHIPSQTPIVYVAIGAMLVGSVVWTKKEGDEVKRGGELGYFAYGGSTIMVVFPKGFVNFDQDLVENSKKPIETLMKVRLFIIYSLILRTLRIICTIGWIFIGEDKCVELMRLDAMQV